MASGGSVTHWLGAIKNGEAAAAQKLWEAYYRRLVGLARQRLGETPRGAADEEDVALSALNSFVEGLAHGRFPQLNDRDDLWRLARGGRQHVYLEPGHRRLSREWDGRWPRHGLWRLYSE
jgi:hypothetical protein